MFRTLAMVIALSFAAGAVSAAPALDAQGKCRDGGKFVKADLCKAAAPAADAKAPKKCVKGKACGNTCIAKTDTCHK